MPYFTHIALKGIVIILHLKGILFITPETFVISSTKGVY